MTIVVIGPLTQDQIITSNSKTSVAGGASYFQSFVFEEFNMDYVVVANFNNLDLIKDFPNLGNLIPIVGDDTHYFINEYPERDNSDIRKQYTNFADIPLLKNQLEFVLDDIFEIDAFILNPLNRNDFPVETIDYLKTFNVPIYLSVQGFLRLPDEKVDDKNYSIKLEMYNDLEDILNGVTGIFLDESEAKIVFDDGNYNKYDIDEIVITNGSDGSRIIVESDEIKIEAVEVDNIMDATGCGDTYMAAYILKRLLLDSPKEAGEFASLIASEKLMSFGPYKSLI
ncbi:PfkB family carbohydrate kinase [Methanobrevibacter smithii]|uniref:PfkB family carbohydrate kinase n=1 Tax=Methanobrevibacter smithii TaxID=2173 RepID=UPI0026E9FB38|nr:PfkB family carbohydrate kinase [Methanobrevibacter smithii]